MRESTHGGCKRNLAVGGRTKAGTPVTHLLMCLEERLLFGEESHVVPILDVQRYEPGCEHKCVDSCMMCISPKRCEQ